MNGFLTRLVSRARAPVAPVRPRVPSRFEAWPPARMPPEDDADGMRASAPPMPVSPLMPHGEPETMAHAAPPAGRAAMPFPVPQPPPVASPRITPSAVPTGVRTHAAGDLPTTTRSLRSSDMAASGPAVAPSGQRRAASEPVVVRAAQGQSSEPTIQAVPLAEPAVQPRRPAEPRSVVAAATRQTMIEPIQTARMSARPPMPGDPRGQPRGAAAETTVHVSIGRIEVRALPEPGGAPRGRMPRDDAGQAVMSLDDYLRSRANR